MERGTEPYQTQRPRSRPPFRIDSQWEASSRRVISSQHTGADLTVNELLLGFWSHVEQHYRYPDGSPTAEVENYRYSLKPLRELYGHTIAANFGPLALKAVRQKMIDTGLSRALVNQRIGRVRRAFKWAVGEGLVSAGVYHGLQAVAGLQRGRCLACEAPPILPYDPTHVEAVLPLVNRHLRGLIQVQLLTGMRPSETCQIRRCDIDTTASVWTYRPAQHKTAWRGKSRAVAIGPAAQQLLKPFFTETAEDYLFSPARAMAERRAEQRAARKSKVPPSQRDRAKRKPKKQPGMRYTHRSYDQAVRLACKKAAVPHWHPNQLRHTFATTVRKQFGLEAAQVGLGHSKADVTQIYAEANLELASKVAREIG